MKTQTRQPVADRRGTALVMVVVLTVLLAVIGVLFVMAARLDEMATSSVVYDQDLDNAVASVVDLIAERLAEDIPVPGFLVTFGDQPTPNVDPWLAPVEPGLRAYGAPGDYTDDVVGWEQVSDIFQLPDPATGQLTGRIAHAIQAGALPYYRVANVYMPADANDLEPADADGDGVVDSYWVRLGLYDPVLNRFVVPYMTGSRARPVFAAVRIVDNCAMLNLNTASHIPDPNTWPDLQGRFLASVDYRRFLRGTDRLNPLLIQAARQGGVRSFLPPPGIDPPAIYHNNALMHIEYPGDDANADGLPDYVLFDIADELEIRNRFMLTSAFEARFERKDVSNFTFDAGGGIYSYLSIPRDVTNYAEWVWRLDPNNFDDRSGAYVGALGDYTWKYDRRHVCTFYSFDRNLRFGKYPMTDGASPANPVTMIFPPDAVAVSTNFGVWDPATQRYNYNNTQTRMQILRLLYAYRAYFLAKNSGWDYKRAARQACQCVANMIDYVDDTNPLSEGPFFNGGLSPQFTGYGGQRNQNPTFINRAVIKELIREVSGYLSSGKRVIDIDTLPIYEFGIGLTDRRETIYGYERQPFISEIARLDHLAAGILYAIELCNPYDKVVNIENWRLKIGSNLYVFTSALDPSGNVDVPAATGFPASRILGRRVLVSGNSMFAPGNDPDPSAPHYLLVGMTIPVNTAIELQRPDPSVPGQYITVDSTRTEQADTINAMNAPNTFRVSKRDDTKWRFARAGLYTTNDNVQTLKMPNLATALGNQAAYQMPVEDRNDPIDTLHDFEMVLLVGSERDPNGTVLKPITEYMATGVERNVRMDVLPRSTFPWLPRTTPLDYVCFMGRPEGSLPGRININTATMEVIRAAIRDRADLKPTNTIDNAALARNIVRRRYDRGLPWPYRRITDLIDATRGIGFDRFVTDPNDNVGDPEMVDDFEERDWLLSQVANLFTVRSDVFTAYILVRLDHDGPQRRMIAIFDRTNVTRDPFTDELFEKPRLIALHPVPDPR